jgi:hypothetical protein
MTLGMMLGRRLYRSVFIGIIREAMAAADAAGIRVPPYAGKLDYYGFLTGRGAGLRKWTISMGRFPEWHGNTE